MHALAVWALWPALVLDVAAGFTQPGRRRFVEWVTGLALNVEAPTLTQSLVGLDRPGDGKALEEFAEYGPWELPLLESSLGRTVGRSPDALGYGFHVWAGDATKVHRNSAEVWGTCTFHEYTARCPNRATTVRAPNGVVLGALVPQPEAPACFLPVAGRLYFRASQLPATGETFRTTCALLVDLLRHQAQATAGPPLGVFDGGFALGSVVRPLVRPDQPGQPRSDVVTRLRHDARLWGLPPQTRRPGQRGPRPRWGRPLPPPRQGGRWAAPWQEGKAFLYGRVRKVRWKEVVCLWRVLGPGVPVKVVVAEVEGYRQRCTLVTSALTLTGLHVVELFGARFRQEDAFRDLKQRLGWEECRAWTKNPLVRTTQTLFATWTLLRRWQGRLEEVAGDSWWLHPPWNPRKARPSVLDVERWRWRHRAEIQQGLASWLGKEGKAGVAAREAMAM